MGKGSTQLGRLTRTRQGVRFEFERAVTEAVGLGLPILSMSMPTSVRSYPDRGARPFFDGLLPEGEARRIIAYDLGIPEPDTFGLLQALGRDCAGALAILPAGELPLPSRAADELPTLHQGTIDGLIANLRVHPLGVDNTVRASLAGVQDKLLLTRRSDGTWARPTADVASTHLLKPSIPGLVGSVANEALCLRIASLAGVRAALARTEHFGGRDVLVVERFDRRITATGQVARVHQETACQALAVPVAATARKYEDGGGPSLRSMPRCCDAGRHPKASRNCCARRRSTSFSETQTPTH